MPIKKYRKKPVVIKASELTIENIAEVASWCGASIDALKRGITIPTLEGNMFADVGDYIIQGVSNEFYPCKPDIFAKTYEVADG